MHRKERGRGGRVAEGGGLLNRYTTKVVSWVRIPSPPPFLRVFLYPCFLFHALDSETVKQEYFPLNPIGTPYVPRL